MNTYNYIRTIRVIDAHKLFILMWCVHYLVYGTKQKKNNRDNQRFHIIFSLFFSSPLNFAHRMVYLLASFGHWLVLHGINWWYYTIRRLIICWKWTKTEMRGKNQHPRKVDFSHKFAHFYETKNYLAALIVKSQEFSKNQSRKKHMHTHK